MAKLKAIYSQDGFTGRKVLRADWDNDRHQQITFKDDEPESVADALMQMAQLIKQEKYDGEI